MTTNESIIIKKTLELCQTIVDQPEFQTMRQQVDAFLADPNSQSQYKKVVDLSEELQNKRRSGAPMTNEDISDFEKGRASLLENPIAKGFLEAQEAMHQVQASVNQYVAKTFELGRMPNTGDFEPESCGPSCGCES